MKTTKTNNSGSNIAIIAVLCFIVLVTLFTNKAGYKVLVHKASAVITTTK